MADQNDNTGCIAPIVIVCTIIAAIMIFVWVGKGVTSFIKENPGGFFVIVALIALIGWAYLSEKWRN